MTTQAEPVAHTVTYAEKESRVQFDRMSVCHRAVCSCGWDGRWWVNLVHAQTEHAAHADPTLGPAVPRRTVSGW